MHVYIQRGVLSALKTFFQTKLVHPLIGFLRQGVTPPKLALSLSLGISIGLFPVLGATTLLCGIIAYTLKLNQPAIQLVNYFIYPLQLILFIPFFKLGGWLFNEPFNYSLGEIYDMMSSDFWAAFHLLWMSNARAVLVWILLAPVLTFVVYYSTLPVLQKFNINLEKKDERKP